MKPLYTRFSIITFGEKSGDLFTFFTACTETAKLLLRLKQYPVGVLSQLRSGWAKGEVKRVKLYLDMKMPERGVSGTVTIPVPHVRRSMYSLEISLAARERRLE